MIEAMDDELVLAGIKDHPKVLLADARYCSSGSPDVLVTTGRLSHDGCVMATP
jgi:hypothetical protein